MLKRNINALNQDSAQKCTIRKSVNLTPVWLEKDRRGGECARENTVATLPPVRCSIHVLIWTNETSVAGMNE